ncbi:MAG: hypothetical protein EBS96_03600, partial [Spartobacteria bacterium]|nr:hypothetical protein [Spartobacteria bacterium]
MRVGKLLQKFAGTFVFLLLLAMTPLLAQAQKPAASSESEMPSGLIVLTGFEGDVKLANAQNPDGQRPSRGTKLQKGDIILTGPESSASLAFSNGSVLEVQSSSKFSIEEFLQKPWDFDEAAFKKLEKEPTSSQTKLKLDYGDVVCKVKKLSSTSTMVVSTPLGVAGIRGTTFKVTVRINSDGTPQKAQVSVVEGAVAFSQSGGSEAPLVTAGWSSTISVKPSEDGAGGQFVTFLVTAPLTMDQRTEIMQVISQVIEQIGEFIKAAVAAQDAVVADRQKEGTKDDESKKEGDTKTDENLIGKLPPPTTGAEQAAAKAAANVAANVAQAQAEAQA